MFSRLLIFFALFFSSFVCFSQTDTHIITLLGNITDTQNKPLENVNVLNITAQIGTATDKNGKYQLTIINKTASLIFSHIGYKTIYKKITEETLKNLTNDTLYWNVVMENEVQKLTLVEITSQKIMIEYTKPNTEVLDYEFYKDAPLVLVLEGNQYKLQLIETVDSILSELNLKLKITPEKLFKDCLGNNNLLVGDTVYELRINIFFEIEFISAVCSDSFNIYIEPCIASTIEYLFLRKFGPNNQSIFYYCINKDNKELKIIDIIFDKQNDLFAAIESAKIEGLKASGIGEFDINHELILKVKAESRRGLSPEKQQAIDDDNIRIGLFDWVRQYRESESFNKILTKPIYNPLIKARDSIYIFSHIDNSVYVLNNRSDSARKFDITYHFENGWAKEIIVNEEKQNAYAKFIKEGIVYLKQINLDNGEIIKTYKLEKHIFPEKIKIKNGYAYYLYREKDMMATKKLYKQQLE